MFERKSMEEIVESMVNWSRGVTTKITDFRVGSRVRTLYEAVGLIVEEQYDKMYRAIKDTIEQSVYTVFGFEKMPATNAQTPAVFSRTTPADTDYLIPAGTVITTKATERSAPIKFQTTADAVIPTGATTSGNVTVVCLTAGTVGMVEANTITDFVSKPAGIETVTNPSAATGGLDEESKDAQKMRFQKFIQSLMRGTTASIEYGATTAQVLDVNGSLLERVVSSRCFEDTNTRKGEVDVYVWNGIGAASGTLTSEVSKVLVGYYTDKGEAVYGYKPAGVKVNVYSAVVKSATLRLTITLEQGYVLNDLKPTIVTEVDGYFANFQLGQTFVQTALESRIKVIAGVYDIKLDVSLDGGATYNQNNVTAASTEVITVAKPLIYT